MVGIVSYGGYVPRYRLDRKKIFQAMGWMDPSTASNMRGEKAVANFDEDSLTMAVAAGLDGLAGRDRSKVEGLYFASTSMPYKERLNAGIITAALGLRDQVRGADFAGGLKAGTTALLSALESIGAGGAESLMVCASDCRLGRPASGEEMIFGDGAAAFLVGKDEVIAEFKGSYSITYDFSDHYRGEFAKFDRKWEDRWIRDLGYDHFIPEVIKGFLKKYDLKITDFTKVIYDCHYGAERKKLNKILGITAEMDQGNFQEQIGHTGAAQSPIMLAGALEQAKPGDRLLVVSFGSGCDALGFEVTDNIKTQSSRRVISGSLANRADLDVYEKYLVWRDILPAEVGLRSEEDLWTRWTALWRKRKEVLGLWGSRCLKCGTPQFPAQEICVNPQCGAVGQKEEYLFSDKVGKVVSFTGDMLAASYNPPAIYGAVEFEGGGKYYFDFVDCTLADMATGMPVTMSFRRKYYDKKRDISGYFWKAVPLKEGK
ncbi:MAG TPA: 3-oxoacyl-[acyl-carrier-protein] synthase III C-terminal domain-containing protein [Thermodesulfobacteriota bacterium]|nr:3-oxoacyl-[acyl-carrier-protein] synthase III C-terminal domain-containing protein [Thermodesulfobacteriota bacterium]